jgi:hypothetical protein
MKRSAGFAGAALVAATALGLAVLAGAGPDEGLINVGLTSAGARVEAESQFSPAHAGSNAADGRMESGNGCWYSRDQSKLPVALTFRFAQAEEVRRIVVWQARWTGNMYHTRDFALETSQDGKAWSRVTAGSLADDNEARAELPVSFKAPWARIVVLSSYNDFQTCGLAEVEFMARRPLAFGTPAARLDSVDAAWSLPFCGLTLAGTDRGSQAAATPGSFLADLPAGGAAELGIPVAAAEHAFSVSGKLEAAGGRVDAALYQGGKLLWEAKGAEGAARVAAQCEPGAGALRMVLRAAGGPVSAKLSGWSATMGALSVALPLAPPPGSNYLARTPVYRPAIERALIEWDWRQQDGLGTPNEPVTPAAAAAKAVARLERLAKGAEDSGTEARATSRAQGSSTAQNPQHARATYQACGAALAAAKRSGSDEAYEAAYLRARWASRRLLLTRAGDRIRPLVFAKQAPGVFSHQLTQYYGRYARPGGGIVTLANPGQAMAVRSLTGALGKGSVMQPDVSWDGKRILFTFCATDSDPVDTVRGQYGRYYSLYAVNADGSGLRRLTSGPNDDFAPRWLPDGKYVCVSTRRGGWHRCGTPGCENYTLAVAAGEGAVPVPISYHETQEWDPAVLHDGRIVYTRWDYVDRHPVFYEHLWTTNPDGTRAAILSGNATFNPVGIWEPQAVPGSNLIMATAAAHHAMTAGSVILVDPTKGPDSKSALIRLTPETPFPESEATVTPNWRATMPGTTPLETVESRRWPGHCYRSPFPLAEDLFLASFSYIELLGEPRCNAPGMFGLYLCDAAGNREMLYRDPNISSVWAMPLRPRPMPRRISSPLAKSMGDEGLMLLQDVYHATPALPRGSVKSPAHRPDPAQVNPRQGPARRGCAQRLAGQAGARHRPRGGRRLGLLPPARPPRSGPAGAGPSGHGRADHAQRHLRAAGRAGLLRRVPRAPHGGAPGPRAHGLAPRTLEDTAWSRRLQAHELPHPRAAGAGQALRLVPLRTQAGRRRGADGQDRRPLHSLVQRHVGPRALLRHEQLGARQPARTLRLYRQQRDEAGPGGPRRGQGEPGRHRTAGDLDGRRRHLLRHVR